MRQPPVPIAERRVAIHFLACGAEAVDSQLIIAEPRGCGDACREHRSYALRQDDRRAQDCERGEPCEPRSRSSGHRGQ